VILRDPHIRFPNDPGPLLPGTQKRLRWPTRDNPDVFRVRQGVQESARGLFLLSMQSGIQVLAEGYYPEDWQASQSRNIDRFTLNELQQGRLGIMGIRFFIFNGLDSAVYGIPANIEDGGPIKMKIGDVLLEVKRNNRQARSLLRRTYDVASWKLEEATDRESEEESILARIADASHDAMNQTEKAMGKKRGSIFIRD